MHSVHPTPKFSIITVTYNAEKVLEDTIQSVISQTYHHVEYIIVDGASKDGTLAIIDRYRERIHTVVSEPDKGLYDAMNKGITLASGDYLCFLNAGDCFHEDDTLQQMVHSINGNELPDVLYGETDLEKFQAGNVGLPSGFLPPPHTGGTLQPELSLFRRLRLVHPHHEESAYTPQYPLDDYRLSGRRNDYPQPESVSQRKIPYHGCTLRADWHCSPSCLVCPAVSNPTLLRTDSIEKMHM